LYVLYSTQEAPCVEIKIILRQKLFSGAFCHRGMFILLKSTLNSASFDIHKPHILWKNFWTLIMYNDWPGKAWPFRYRLVDLSTFFHIFPHFWKVYTLGWVDFWLFYIFNKSTPEICYIPSKSTEMLLTHWPLHHWSWLFGSCTI
jgi:hypothetical protein